MSRDITSTHDVIVDIRNDLRLLNLILYAHLRKKGTAGVPFKVIQRLKEAVGDIDE